METLVIVSNLLLVVLTGIYVFLTYMLLKQTVAANNTSRETIERQFRIQTFPSVYCSVSTNDGRITITIYNPGEAPLFDVEVLYLGLYNTEDVDIPTFIIKHVHPKYRNTPLKANEHGFFGVRGYAVYPVFPQSRKVSFPSKIPEDSNFIYILLQLRDMLGVHYSQLYSFAHDGVTNLFRLVALEPNVVAPAPRVKIDINDKIVALKTDGDEKLPQHLNQEDFTSLLSDSISEGYLEGDFVFWEDRREWMNL